MAKFRIEMREILSKPDNPFKIGWINECARRRELNRILNALRLELPGDVHTAAATGIKQAFVDALSSRDAEIREVLEGLATYRNPLCWCPPNTEAEPHTEACRATTVLYAKLQPAQINGASSTPKG